MNMLKPSVKTIGVVVVLLILVISGGVWAKQQSDLRAKKAQELAIKKDKSDYENSRKTSSGLRGRQKYDEAVKVLQDYASISINTQNKAYSYVSIAGIYESEQDYKTALTNYRQAEKIINKKDYAVSKGIARTSQKLGDNKTAIMHYQICIDILTKADAATFGADIMSLKDTIKQLETKP